MGDEVESIELNGGIQDVFSIGNTPSICLDLVLRNTSDTIYNTTPISVEIGLNINNKIEYVPLGIFNINSIKKDDFTIKIIAYDNMSKFKIAYFSSLGDTATLTQVANEIATKTGVQFEGSLPAYTVKKLEGFSCREILSFIASLCGGNAIINRNGKFTIVYPTDINRDIGEGYFDFTREETKYKIGKITCKVEDKTISKGSLGSDSMEMQFENPWMNETILTDIYNRLNGYEYLGYNLKWQGDPSLDIGDIITHKDDKGVIRKLPIFNMKLSYDGGLDSELSAKGETKNKNSFDSSGSMKKKIDRVVTELAIVNEALIDVAYIGDLTAGNIKFDTASGNIMDLQTLLAKFVTGENGQFLNLTTDNVVIANAVIKDAMIENLSLNKLLAGTISTNKFNILSDDGGITIVGPTMQFKDKSNKVRLQLGQDTAGDFNFILIAADGTTTLIDGYGIKEKAIADKLIKSNMVADGAIGEQQINYSSLVTGLNKDTNTSLIQSSKVAIDLTGQSLDIAFNTLKTNVEGLDEKTESNTTAISAIQGNIKTLIKDTTIEKDGVTTTLKDAYSVLDQTVSGINTTVASQTTSIGNLTTDLSSLSEKVTTAETSITQLNNKIALKVEATEVNTIVNNAIDGAISAVDTKIGTTDKKVTSIETNLSSITERVSSTENKVLEIDGNILSLQIRMYSAEQKITDSAIISTVQTTINNAMNSAINSANSSTDTKLQSYATKTEVTTTAENVIYKFSASGGYNLLKNSAFANKQIDNWWVWGGVSRWTTESYYKEVGDMYIANPNTNNPGGLWQSEIPIKPNTKYTLSVACYKEGNVKGGWFGLEYQSSPDSSVITYQNIELTFDDKRHSYTFTTPNNSAIKYAKVGFRHEGAITTDGGYLIKINKPCLAEGEVSVWSPNPFEVKDGSTIIDADGVKIYNGALTVLNNAGQIMLQGDSNGDLTFRGRLQPNDYQIKLFGDNCKIDGSANAIRLQWNPQTYVSVEDPYIRTFNKYSSSGTNYGSIGVNSEGHFTIFGQRTMLKLLGNSSDTAIVQARWTSDTAYAAFAGSDFLNRSTIKDKTNVEAIEEVDFSKILLENNIFKYNLKKDVESVLNRFGLDEEYNSDEVVSSSADVKLGFILEELTDEAKALLNPYDEDAISVYSMCSILWKVCQEQQKRIEVLESLQM